MVGAVGVELLWNGGSVVGVSSSEFTRGGGDVLRVRGRERARGRVDCDAGSPGVLRRAQDGSPRHCREPSTAALRWQPAELTGARGTGWRGTARGNGRWEEVQCDAWMPREAAAKLEVAPGRQAARQSTGGGENRGRSWRKEKKGHFAISEISKDQTIK